MKATWHEMRRADYALHIFRFGFCFLPGTSIKFRQSTTHSEPRKQAVILYIKNLQLDVLSSCSHVLWYATQPCYATHFLFIIHLISCYLTQNNSLLRSIHVQQFPGSVCPRYRTPSIHPITPTSVYNTPPKNVCLSLKEEKE